MPVSRSGRDSPWARSSGATNISTLAMPVFEINSSIQPFIPRASMTPLHARIEEFATSGYSKHPQGRLITYRATRGLPSSDIPQPSARALRSEFDLGEWHSVTLSCHTRHPILLEVSPAFATRRRDGTGQVVGSARDKSMTLGLSTKAECITTAGCSLVGIAAATFTEAVSTKLTSSNRRCFMAAS